MDSQWHEKNKSHFYKFHPRKISLWRTDESKTVVVKRLDPRIPLTSDEYRTKSGHEGVLPFSKTLLKSTYTMQLSEQWTMHLAETIRAAKSFSFVFYRDRDYLASIEADTRVFHLDYDE